MNCTPCGLETLVDRADFFCRIFEQQSIDVGGVFFYDPRADHFIVEKSALFGNWEASALPETRVEKGDADATDCFWTALERNTPLYSGATQERERNKPVNPGARASAVLPLTLVNGDIGVLLMEIRRDEPIRPDRVERVREALNERRWLTTLARYWMYRCDLQTGRHPFVTARSPEWNGLMKNLVRGARMDVPVVIHGRTGTGKEHAADFMYWLSDRNDEQFVKVNCGAVKDQLLMSEMFGTRKGAFTGAEDRSGKFEMADGGTILLDEVADLPQKAQQALLRFLESGEIEILGTNDTRQVDVRILTSSNRRLLEEVERGRFREDLFARLNVHNIEMPPLERHPEMIPKLVRVFSSTFRTSQPRLNGVEFDPGAVAALRELCSYPRNCRQLWSMVRKLMYSTENRRIRRPHVKQLLSRNEYNEGEGDNTDTSAQTVRNRQQKAPPSAPDREHSFPEKGREKVEDRNYGELDRAREENERALPTLEDVEKALIERRLKKFQGNKTRTAESLGISRKALYNKLSRYNISEPQKDS